MTLIRQLENRRKYEEREKKKHQVNKTTLTETLKHSLYRYYVTDGTR